MGGLAKTNGFLEVFDDFGVFFGSGRESSGHLGAYVGTSSSISPAKHHTADAKSGGGGASPQASSINPVRIIGLLQGHYTKMALNDKKFTLIMH